MRIIPMERFGVLTLSLLTALGIGPASLAFAQTLTDQAAATATPEAVTASDLVALQVGQRGLVVDEAQAAREAEINAAVQSFLEKARSDGQGLGVYNGMQAEGLTIRGAAVRALEENLDIKGSRIAEQIARHLKTEAAAVFEPVFLLTFNRNVKEDHERVEQVNRFSRASEKAPVNYISPPVLNNPVAFPGLQVLDIIPFDEGPIAALSFTEPRAAGRRPQLELAHEANITATINRNTAGLRLSQQMPWGMGLDLSYTLKEEPNYFTLGFNTPTSEAIFDTYNKDWTGEAQVNFATPLPFTKDWGRTAPADFEVDLRQLGMRTAFWNTHAQINDTLLQVENAFWAVVRGVHLVRARGEVLGLIEDLSARTERLFELQQITEPDRAQVAGQLLSVRGSVEQAFIAYVTASNNLRQLLNLDTPVLFMPSGYLGTLESADLDLDDTLLIRDNPEYLGAMVRLKTAKLERDFADNQTLPDLKFQTSYKSTQFDSKYGFDNPGRATNYTFTNPDKKEFNASVSYRRILRNRAATAAMANRDHLLRIAGIDLRDVENRLERDFRNARINLKSARERVKITERNVELAENVYDRAQRLQQARRVTEFEIIDAVNQLLVAKDQHVDAQIQVMNAETQLLNAAGMLPKRFAERTAQTEYDRYRLRLLSQLGMLKHFGGVQ